MRLEDSLLYLILDDAVGSAPAAFCEAAIAGGVDVIHLSAGTVLNAEYVAEIKDVCHANDALFVVSDNPALAMEMEADGVHLSSAEESFGQVRAMVGVDGIVGISTHNAGDAVLGIGVGADYLLHWAGRGAPAAFSGLSGAAGCTLFAAGLSSPDDARAVVEGGVYRLCVEASLLADGDVTENAAAFSRLLGRMI